MPNTDAKPTNISEISTADFIERIEGKLRQGKLTLFASGGSSLRVLEKLGEVLLMNDELQDRLGELTLSQVDERYFPEGSYQPAGEINREKILATSIGNYLQENFPQNLVFFPESQQNLPAFEQDLQQLLSDSTSYKTALMGIGSDYHTAGIKPIFEKDAFNELFMNEQKLLATYNAEDFPARSTLTFTALDKFNELSVALIGQEKRELVVKFLHDTQFWSEKTIYKYPAKIYIKNQSQKILVISQ